MGPVMAGAQAGRALASRDLLTACRSALICRSIDARLRGRFASRSFASRPKSSRSLIDSVRKSIRLIERINQNCLPGDTVSTPKTRDGDKMNGLALTGCFSAGKPVATPRVGATRPAQRTFAQAVRLA